jgi:hypothetical protein
LAKNINTNSELPNNFLDMERITNTRFFEPQVGDMSIFERNEAYILNQIPVEVNPANNLERFRAKIRDNVSNQNQQSSVGQKQKSSSQKSIKDTPKEKLSTEKPIELLYNKYTPILLLGVAAIIGIYFYTKKKKG